MTNSDKTLTYRKTQRLLSDFVYAMLAFSTFNFFLSLKVSKVPSSNFFRVSLIFPVRSRHRSTLNWIWKHFSNKSRSVCLFPLADNKKDRLRNSKGRKRRFSEKNSRDFGSKKWRSRWNFSCRFWHFVLKTFLIERKNDCDAGSTCLEERNLSKSRWNLKPRLTFRVS